MKRTSYVLLVVQFLFYSVAYSQDWRTALTFPKVNLSDLTPSQRGEALKMLREENCPCGCGMKLAQCLIDDPTCPKSPSIGSHVVRLASRGHNSLSILRGVWAQEMLIGRRGGDFIEKPQNAEPGVTYYAFESFGDRYQCDKCSKWHRRVDAKPYDWELEYPRRLQTVLTRFRQHHKNWIKSTDEAITEDNIIRQLNLIDQFRGTDKELHAALAKELKQGFSDLDKAVYRYFESIGKKIELAPSQPGTAPAGRFDGGVRVTTTPGKADLYYIDEKRFIIIDRLKMVNDNYRIWDEFGSTTGTFKRKLTPGDYRIYAWWPSLKRYAYSRKLTVDDKNFINVDLKAY